MKVLQKIVTSKAFRMTFLAASVIFIIATFFISLDPEKFTRYGYPGVFALNVAGSGILLIPTLSTKFNLILLVITCGLGNMLNTSVNYLVGSSGKSFLLKFSFMEIVKKWMKKFEVIAIYLLAIAPLPLDVNGILSGSLGVSYKKYILINFLGKITIFFLVGLGVIAIAKH